MGPEHFWWTGWWIFPMVMPLFMVILVVFVIYAVFGRGGARPPWGRDSNGSSSHPQGPETAIEILRKRYAKGELTREQFEQMKKDLST
jgi:putative membrane protein